MPVGFTGGGLKFLALMGDNGLVFNGFNANCLFLYSSIYSSSSSTLLLAHLSQNTLFPSSVFNIAPVFTFLILVLSTFSVPNFGISKCLLKNLNVSLIAQSTVYDLVSNSIYRLTRFL